MLNCGISLTACEWPKYLAYASQSSFLIMAALSAFDGLVGRIGCHIAANCRMSSDGTCLSVCSFYVEHLPSYFNEYLLLS